MRKWSNEEIKRYLGDELGCYLTWSADDEVRVGAASGGTTTQLCINLLEGGIVDGVVVWRMVYGEEDPRTEAVIATNREELLAARGSKYCSVSYPKAMGKIQAFEGKLACVTVPCDASYLRRKMKADPELAEKIRLIITLFCGHNSEPALTKLLVERHGMKWRDVTDFSYRTGRWRGVTTFSDADGNEVEIPTRTFTHYQNLHLFSERKCLFCVDHFGYDGDICTGDIWSQKHRNRDIKPTLLVAKTDRGKELFESARANIHAEQVPPKTVVDGNSRGMTYHYNVSARSRAAKRLGLKLRDPLRLPVTTLDTLIASIGVLNYKLSHEDGAQERIRSLPFPLIQAYIYFFKGLQQLNLLLYRPFPPVERVSLIGATLTGNRGAEAMLVTSIARAREALPKARYVVHSYFPKRDREIVKDLDVDVVDAGPAALVLKYFPFAVLDGLFRLVGARWPRRLTPHGPRELSDSKVLLDVFGVAYSDGREKFLPFNILSNLPAMLYGVPVVKLSQALGPFEGRLNRAVAKTMLRACERVFARGDETLRMLRDLGIDEDKVDLAADIAFAFQPEDAITDENRDYEQEIVSRLEDLRCEHKVLTIGISSVVHQKCTKAGIDYPEAIARIARHFLERDLVVVLFPNATREQTESLHNNDLPVIAEIAERIGDDARLVAITRDLNTASLRRILARAHLLVASRFHAMIAGLSLGLPTMVLGWGHKYAEVLAQFDIEEWAFDFSSIDADLLIGHIERFVAQEEELKRRVRDRIHAVRELSARQFEWLRDFIAPDLARDTAGR
jgi:coenzyme F420-reducing hydrogenase beta subunit/polysaccharide pyruvyl transferase WcaK-like protein